LRVSVVGEAANEASKRVSSKSIGDDDYARDALSVSYSVHDSLGAKEGVCKDRVADNAVAECDELKIIDEEYMARVEHDIVHAGHVDGARGDDVAGENPVAVNAQRVPRRHKSWARACGTR